MNVLHIYPRANPTFLVENGLQKMAGPIQVIKWNG